MDDFADIAYAHFERYPQMQPLDLIKLAYQSEFGPGHLITDQRKAATWITQEWEAAPKTHTACNPEPIGNGLCRLHMTPALFSPQNVALLCKLFIQSAQQHQGTNEGLTLRLRAIVQLPIAGMEEHILRYYKQGCPSVHHSEVYRSAYRPHYRVLLAKLADAFPVQR